LQCGAVRRLDPRFLSGLLRIRLRKHGAMADAPDYWRVRYRHGPVVGWAVSRGRSPVRCPCCMCGCGSLAGVVFETVTTTIGGIFDTCVPGGALGRGR